MTVTKPKKSDDTQTPASHGRYTALLIASFLLCLIISFILGTQFMQDQGKLSDPSNHNFWFDGLALVLLLLTSMVILRFIRAADFFSQYPFTSLSVLNAALSTAKFGLWVTDEPNGNISFDPHARKLLGLSLESISIAEFLSMLHIDDKKEVLKTIKNSRPSGVFSRLEFRFNCPDGRSRVVFVSGKQLAEDLKDKQRFAGIIEDASQGSSAENKIEEHRRFEQLIARYSTELNNANKATIETTIKRMLKDIGHSNQLDRFYYLHFAKGSRKAPEIFEWHQDGLTSLVSQQADFSLRQLPNILKRFEALSPIKIDALEEASFLLPKEIQAFSERNTKAIVLVPIGAKNQATGMMCAESLVSRVTWSDEHISRLGIIGGVIERALHQLEGEEALRRQSLAIENMIEGILITNDEGRIVEINKAAEDMLGHPRAVAINAFPIKLLSVEDPHEFARRTLNEKTGEIISFENLNYKGKNGVLRIIDVTVVPLDDFSRDHFSYVAVIHDVTKRTSAERNLIAHKNQLEKLVENRTIELASANSTLQIAAKEAQAANIAKSEFLSSMSHELRTPLNAILGFGHLLMLDSDNPLNQTQLEWVDFMIKGGNHLLELINDVLDLAQIESGKLRLTVEPIKPEGILENAIEMAKAMVPNKNIIIEDHITPRKLPHIVADPMRLKQILLNLLSNAVKYNRDSGKVEVDCEIGEQFLRITIKDTGIGIPIEKQHQLFQPFRRLGYETSNIEGTGIGLLITKELLTQMKGQLGFESVVNEGSTFWFELPLAKNSPTLSSKIDLLGDQQSEDNPRNKETAMVNASISKVLYIEDNLDNLYLMEMFLERIPELQIISATTAKAGLELAESQQPSLILMDINLPDISGIEAMAILQKNPSTKDIPVIAVSAAAMPEEIERGVAAGFCSYLTKPILLDVTLDTIREHILRPSPSSATEKNDIL